MVKVLKPSKKVVWRGQKGNKFRVYQIRTTEGNIISIQNRAQAFRVYNANVRVYKKRISKK